MLVTAIVEGSYWPIVMGSYKDSSLASRKAIINRASMLIYCIINFFSSFTKEEE